MFVKYNLILSCIFSDHMYTPKKAEKIWPAELCPKLLQLLMKPKHTLSYTSSHVILFVNDTQTHYPKLVPILLPM